MAKKGQKVNLDNLNDCCLRFFNFFLYLHVHVVLFLKQNISVSFVYNNFIHSLDVIVGALLVLLSVLHFGLQDTYFIRQNSLCRDL